MLFRSVVKYALSCDTVSFQSAKRICAVSKVAREWAEEQRESFNPPSGFVLFRRPVVQRPTRAALPVSIRQADLCCFEGAPAASEVVDVVVSIRQADLCCFEVHQLRRVAAGLDGFNPPSGFVLFRSVGHEHPYHFGGSFNPPSGFVLFRRMNTRIVLTI